MAENIRKERMKERQNALETALAGLLIAQGNGVRTAERKAQNAMKCDWNAVKREVEARGYSYLRMMWEIS